MIARHLVIMAALGGFGVGALASSPAQAQSNTTGAIQGQVTNADTGENLAGVTVVVTSPALQGSQVGVSGDDGVYKITDLPPGIYLVTFYIDKLTIQRSDVGVGVNKTTPVFQRIKLSQAPGEIVRITDRPPAIDPTSTTQGTTLDRDYLNSIPIPGRTFEAALGAAAGSQRDLAGVSFSGSSSLENQYIVDGINVTGLTFGTVGTPMLNAFIEEIEIITGGYNAEHGQSTGAVVNVVTKTGTNELKGSIFTSFQPGFLTAPAESVPVNASSVDAVANIGYVANLGFEVGGPIIRDRLWFLVGFAPLLARTDVTRTTKRQTDCRTVLPSGGLSTCDPRLQRDGGNADASPDVDPRTGFYITDTLDEEVRSSTAQAYYSLGKLNFAATPENQAQLTLTVLPTFASTPEVFGLANTGVDTRGLITDVSLKWTTKLNDNKTEIEGLAGLHLAHVETMPMDPALADRPLQLLTDGSLGAWGPGFGGESASTNAGCADGVPGSADVYPYLGVNCPMTGRAYFVGGPGSLVDDSEQRLSAKAAVTQRVKALGNHEVKAGIEVESDSSDKVRLFTGGSLLENFVNQNRIRVTRWVQLKGKLDSPQVMGDIDPRFDNQCRTPNNLSSSVQGTDTLTYVCDYLPGTEGYPGTQVTSNTLNWAAYLRDSWQILPNLTVNAGLRYEEQRLRYAAFLQHTTDPLTQESLGKNAMVLQNMWAPRVGAIYDWTQEGRSKVYANWGRFYESIPMDINARAFGGEVLFVQDFAASSCGMRDDAIGGQNGVHCLDDPNARGDGKEQLVGASGTLVAPGIKPQYLDEFVAGVEYELLDDVKVGLAYQNRVLGRVIEDVSPDGANTYLIANPGEWSSAEEAKLRGRIDRLSDGDPEKDRLQHQLALFRGIRIFDKPRRDYNAIVLTVTGRFANRLRVQGSYTYSRTTGNYPGLISVENSQVDPNISSQYDLIELLANHKGPLPQDRPHSIKLDGSYLFDLGMQGQLLVGARVRAFSGIPQNALAAHYLYGANESYLLPRGSMGRSDFEHGVDLQIVYGRKLSRGMELDIGATLFNVYNHQGTASVDNTYARAVSLSGTLQNANPVSGGSYEDLIWVKQIDDKGDEQRTPVSRNPNFGNTTSRYTPLLAVLGATLSF